MSCDQEAAVQLEEPVAMFQEPVEEYEGPPTPETTPGGRKHNKPDGVSLEVALERNDQLERENRLLRRRLRQAEKELTDIKVAPNASIHARNAAEARERAARIDATSDDVTRAVNQRDSSLVELRRRVEIISMRLGKVDKEEDNDKDGEEGAVAATGRVTAGVDEDWDDDTVDTSYDTADEDARSVHSTRAA